MFKSPHNFALTLGFCTLSATTGWAQNSDGDAAFSSENAIMNTAIPFAIGAQEAQQSLRSSFGWATFQEGLVEGVYFRFDPDGYARFAPNPRLDTDVFEVICRSRTYDCAARKGVMMVFTNSKNQLEIKLDQLQTGDTFFLSEGVSEIEVPNRILQPLGPQLEALLSSGGELIIRRGEAEVDRVSLTGFSAVSAYLRWVAARQDYSVLPRDWPIPNAGSSRETDTITTAATWRTAPNQPLIVVDPSTVVSNASGAADISPDIERVQDELSGIRELLIEQGQSDEVDSRPETITAGEDSTASLAPAEHPELVAVIARLEKLVQRVEHLELNFTTNNTLLAQDSAIDHEDVSGDVEHTNFMHRLGYLIDEIGLDPETALLVLDQQSQSKPTNDPHAESIDVVSEILAQLEATSTDDLLMVEEGTMAKDIATEIAAETIEENVKEEIGARPKEYVTLTNYFKSVAATLD